MEVLITKQFLPLGINEAWDFFSKPGNLKKITPDYMGFDITSDYIEEEMYPGMIITYKVRPLLNIPLNWATEITHVKKPYYFVDNQKRGPFAVWHHQHHFEEVEGGVQMEDIVHYAAPLGILGLPVEKTIIKQRVKHIFDYRYKILEEYFKNG